MRVLINTLKKSMLIIVLSLVLISFCATPFSYAKLDMKSDEFYYSGTQKGQYVVKEGVFSWLVNALGDVIDWIIGAMTLAFRAPFIGFTELIEKLLTWSIESTAGINSENATLESSTDLLSVVTSKNNVTVQAIVFNQVPAFNINFFNTEYNTEYSPTGKKLVCENCRELCKNCCTLNESGDIVCLGDCNCDGKCTTCNMYVQLLRQSLNTDEKDKPLIIQIKDQVAIWYTIIRLMALVGMLGVLVYVGIQIAISTAIKKATYKRMLVDWVVGVIIIFSLHYAMFLTIYINESLINIVKEYSEGIYGNRKVQLMELAGNEKDYNPDEIETDMYEEVRTRAYDAKLVNGLVGMILYMTLVYMAIRYSLIYLKRLFTVGILVLMGPGVGFAYAIQKATSGRSMALKKWLSEFIINVIIQTVHAIIYSVFISQVLVLSLKSTAGIIVALIIMNFSLKAEGIFRRIFKFSSSDLLKETDKAGNIEENARNMFGAYKGIKAAGSTVGKSLYGRALKGAAVGAAGAVIVKASEFKERKNQKEVDNFGKEIGPEIGEEDRSLDDGQTLDGEALNSRREQTNSSRQGGSEEARARTRLDNAVDTSSRDQSAHPVHRQTPPLNRDSDEIINSKSEKQLKEEYSEAQDTYYRHPNMKNRRNLIRTYNNVYRKEQLDGITTSDVIKGHYDNLFDMSNYYDVRIDSKGNKTYVRKDNNKKYGRTKGAIFGTKHYDYNEGIEVSDKNRAIDQLRVSNLLGFTEKDSKVFNEHVVSPLKKGFLGMAAMYIGLSTFVIHPKLGMGLLAYGIPNKYGSFKKLGYIKGFRKYKEERKYSYVGFTAPTMKNMADIAISRSKYEQDTEVVSNIKVNHPNLYFALKTGAAVASTLPGGSLIRLAQASAAIDMLGRSRYNSRKRRSEALDSEGMPRVERNEDYEEYAPREISEAEYEVNKHHAKQLKEQEKEFKEEALKLVGNEAVYNTKQEIEDFLFGVEQATYRKNGYEIDEEGNIYELVENNDEYDGEYDITRDELVEKINGRGITDAENRKVNEAIEEILIRIANSETIDINSEAKIDQVINELNVELTNAKIITSAQSAEEIFKDGKIGLVNAIKHKTKKINRKIEIENNIFASIDTEEVKAIKEAVEEVLEQELSKNTYRPNIDPDDTNSSDGDDNSDKKVSYSRKDLSRAYNKINTSDILVKVEEKIKTLSVNRPMNAPTGTSNDTQNNLPDDSSTEPNPNRHTDGIPSPIHTQTPENGAVNPNITIPQEKLAQYMEVIDNYVSYKREEVKPKEPKKKELSEREQNDIRNMLGEVIDRKREKLNEALNVYIDDPQKGIIDLYSDETYEGKDPRKILEGLFLMKNINDEAKDGLIKGSLDYKRVKDRKADAETEYNKVRLKIAKLESETNWPRDYEKVLKYDSLSMEDKIRLDKIHKLKKQLGEKEIKMRQAQGDALRSGPIVDINKVVKYKKMH